MQRNTYENNYESDCSCSYDSYSDSDYNERGDILTTIIREEGTGDSHEDQKEDSLRFNRANIEITEELIIKMMICL